MSVESQQGKAQYAEVLSRLTELYQAGRMPSLVPLLPVLLRLKGEPYTLLNHFPMEPVFSSVAPRTLVLKTARQVSKSTTLAAYACLLSAMAPYFSTLYIAPRFEQTRRFSTNYVRPFLTDTPLGDVMVDPSMNQSVLQRSFVNGSLQYFSFAFLDPGRTRGIA